MNNYCLYDSSYLAHHGILGMKWGVRRYQNKDGSLTSAGERRYSTGNNVKSLKKKKVNKDTNPVETKKKGNKSQKKSSTGKKVAIASAAVVGTALTLYGAKKMHDVVRDKNYQYHMDRGRKMVTSIIEDSVKKGYNINASSSSQMYKMAANDAFNKSRRDSFGTALRNARKVRR